MGRLAIALAFIEVRQCQLWLRVRFICFFNNIFRRIDHFFFFLLLALVLFLLECIYRKLVMMKTDKYRSEAKVAV